MGVNFPKVDGGGWDEHVENIKYMEEMVKASSI